MSALSAAEVPARAPLPPEQALQGLYVRNADRILGFCLRRLRSRAEAEDAVQEVFLSAFRALQRGCVPLCESAWLFKIAENVCCSMHRSNTRRNSHQLGEFDEVDALPARDRDGEALFGLEEALASIPATQRRAFVLRELRGLSYREIAAQLGVTVASVETLIFRARRGLAKALESGAGLRERISAGLNVGSLAAALKSWLAGATAAKVAAGTAVLAVAAVSAGDTPARSPQVGEPVSVTELQPASVTRSNLWSSPEREAERAARAATTSTPRRTPVPQHGRRTPVPVRKEAVRRDSGPAQESAPAPNAPAPGAPQPPASQPVPAIPAAPPPPALVSPVTLPEAPVSVPQAPALPAVPPVPPLPVEQFDLSEQLPVVPPLG